MGILEEKIIGFGGIIIGFWFIEGYDYEDFKVVKDGKFVGLVLDDDN